MISALAHCGEFLRSSWPQRSLVSQSMNLAISSLENSIRQAWLEAEIIPLLKSFNNIIHGLGL